MKRTVRISNQLSVAARIMAAVGGGYVLSAAAMSLLALMLPMVRADATIVATMLSFATYAAVIVWAFTVRSAARAWAGIALATGLLAALLWLCRSVS